LPSLVLSKYFSKNFWSGVGEELLKNKYIRGAVTTVSNVVLPGSGAAVDKFDGLRFWTSANEIKLKDIEGHVNDYERNKIERIVKDKSWFLFKRMGKTTS
jgi:hypothetical protein